VKDTPTNRAGGAAAAYLSACWRRFNVRRFVWVLLAAGLLALNVRTGQALGIPDPPPVPVQPNAITATQRWNGNVVAPIEAEPAR
jgi:hypothetical protein